MVPAQRVGHKGERNGKHCTPANANQHKAEEEHVLVMDEEHRCKPCRTEDEAGHIGSPESLELRDNDSPEHSSNGLDGKEHAHPVARGLVVGGLHVRGAPAGIGNRAVGVGPEEKEGCPAEELHKADCPEGLWGLH